MLLDVDNGPGYLVHDANAALYGPGPARRDQAALRPAASASSGRPHATRPARRAGQVFGNAEARRTTSTCRTGPSTTGSTSPGYVRGHERLPHRARLHGRGPGPEDALWRAQTQRAVENFPISGQPLEPAHVHALARIKAAAAQTNGDLGVLTTEQADAITAAAAEVVDGEHDDQFPIDVFQTGSGTSTNMNVNEVIATLAQRRASTCTPTTTSTPPVLQRHVPDRDPRRRRARHPRPARRPRRPARVAGGQGRRVRRRREVRPHPPDGRHAGDPRPGARRVRRHRRPRPRADRGRPAPRPRAAPRRHRRRHRHQHPGRLRPADDRPAQRRHRRAFTEARDHFEAQGSRDSLVELSGVLRTFAVGLVKICNDLRWMSSGRPPAWPRSTCPTSSPGRASCPARSTRSSPRPR